MNPSPAVQSADYELTVSGAIGPVLRCALGPQLASETQNCTIIRTAASSEGDLVDLVLLFHSLGFKVEGVFKVEGARD